MPDQSGMQDKLKLLSDGYAVQLPEKIDQIVETWNGIAQSGWDEAGFLKLHRMTHSLAGSGKTFGFPALSDVARKLDNYFKQLGAAELSLNSEQRTQVGNWLVELRQATHQRIDEPVDRASMPDVATHEHTQPNSRPIYIVEGNREHAEKLKVQLSNSGYKVNLFHTLDAFRGAVNKNTDAVILMDASFPDSERAGLYVVSEWQRQREVKLPIIVMSEHGSIDARLSAVRAGCVAYLNKPVDFELLIHKLDALSSINRVVSYRVLIVDDDVNVTNYSAAVLENAGLEVRVINDPLLALNALFEFSPDLILLDLYMPGCHGLELAKVIRQIDAYIAVPIAFLSDERDQDVRISAFNVGVDDFLEKPITPEYLVARVIGRIKRTLTLRTQKITK